MSVNCYVYQALSRSLKFFVVFVSLNQGESPWPYFQYFVLYLLLLLVIASSSMASCCWLLVFCCLQFFEHFFGYQSGVLRIMCVRMNVCNRCDARVI